MDSLPDLDYYLISQLCLLSLVSFLLGRLSKRVKSEKNFSKSITELNYIVVKSAENKYYFSYLNYRFKIYSSFFLIISLALSFIIYIYQLDYSLEITFTLFFITFSTFICSYISSFKAGQYTQYENLYKQKLTSIRAEIIKEVGPDVVDALRSNECSKKCTEDMQKLNSTITRYKQIIEKLGNFQWCDGCSQQKQCTGKCGPSFWKHASITLRDSKVG